MLCDVQMVASGVTRTPAAEGQRRRLHAQRPAHARRSPRTLGTTRTAAAIELWRDRLDGAVVAIGNAPTALFHLLEMVDAGGPRPAAVIGIPVGFIGAAESKDALAGLGPRPPRRPRPARRQRDRRRRASTRSRADVE